MNETISSEILEKFMDRLKDGKELTIFRNRVFENFTFQKCADIFGLSRTRAQQIFKKTERRFKYYMLRNEFGIKCKNCETILVPCKKNKYFESSNLICPSCKIRIRMVDVCRQIIQPDKGVGENTF